MIRASVCVGSSSVCVETSDDFRTYCMSPMYGDRRKVSLSVRCIHVNIVIINSSMVYI